MADNYQNINESFKTQALHVPKAISFELDTIGEYE